MGTPTVIRAKCYLFIGAMEVDGLRSAGIVVMIQRATQKQVQDDYRGRLGREYFISCNFPLAARPEQAGELGVDGGDEYDQ